MFDNFHVGQTKGFLKALFSYEIDRPFTVSPLFTFLLLILSKDGLCVLKKHKAIPRS